MWEEGCVFTHDSETRKTHKHSLYCECIGKIIDEEIKTRLSEDK